MMSVDELDRLIRVAQNVSMLHRGRIEGYQTISQ